MLGKVCVGIATTTLCPNCVYKRKQESKANKEWHWEGKGQCCSSLSFAKAAAVLPGVHKKKKTQNTGTLVGLSNVKYNDIQTFFFFITKKLYP